MSSRARVANDTEVCPFDWDGRPAVVQVQPEGTERVGPGPSLSAVVPPPAPFEQPVVRTEEIEREAFAKGYAQGERAGAEAAATRADAMLRRLAQTLEELASLRTDVLHRTERDLVQLAIAIAGRIMHREVTMDRELLVAMARVAIDRLGDGASATIRLHPDDYRVAGAAAGEAHPAVRIVADPAVSRGGCLVHSDFGLIDVGIDAQLVELSAALLGESADADQLQRRQADGELAAS